LRAREAEPYGYLLKPIKEVELRAAIEIGLFKRRADQRLRERERWFSDGRVLAEPVPEHEGIEETGAFPATVLNESR
jgi:hypothetical protein